MSISSTPSTGIYNFPQRFLHWATAALVVVAFLVSVGGSESHVYSSANDFDRGLHELLGVLVFVLTIIRLLWRVFDPPSVRIEMPIWMELLSKFTHAVLYFLLLVVPLSAVSGAWLEGHPLTILGVGSISPIISPARQFGLLLSDLHGLLGDALIWLAALHAVAAVFHHLWLRDNVLRSMLPWL